MYDENLLSRRQNSRPRLSAVIPEKKIQKAKKNKQKKIHTQHWISLSERVRRISVAEPAKQTVQTHCSHAKEGNKEDEDQTKDDS